MRFRICEGSRKQRGNANISWRSKSYTVSAGNFEVARRLGRGLLNLAILTTEIEEKLTKKFTQHEKLEWQLEFEAKDST